MESNSYHCVSAVCSFSVEEKVKMCVGGIKQDAIMTACDETDTFKVAGLMDVYFVSTDEQHLVLNN